MELDEFQRYLQERYFNQVEWYNKEAKGQDLNKLRISDDLLSLIIFSNGEVI